MSSFSQYNVPEHAVLVTCPYDKSHRITIEKMPFHLIRCRRNNLDKPMKTCRFNASHVFPEPEIPYHEKNCSDKIGILRHHYHDDHSSKAGKFEKERSRSPVLKSGPPRLEDSDSDENWDNEGGASYNPKEAIQNRAVIRTIQHKTPSERKAEREALRKEMAMKREKKYED